MTGPKTAPMPPVPRRCTRNSATQDRRTVIGTTKGSKSGVAMLETLDRAEHRDGRRDHAVAVEQRRAEEAEDDRAGTGGSAAPLPWPRDERHQREDAALAAGCRRASRR